MYPKLPCVIIIAGRFSSYNRLSGTFGADGLKIKLEKCPGPIILKVTVFIIPKLPSSNICPIIGREKCAFRFTHRDPTENNKDKNLEHVDFILLFLLMFIMIIPITIIIINMIVIIIMMGCNACRVA